MITACRWPLFFLESRDYYKKPCSYKCSLPLSLKKSVSLHAPFHWKLSKKTLLVYYTQTGSPRHAYGVPRDDTNQTTLLSLLSNQEKKYHHSLYLTKINKSCFPKAKNKDLYLYFKTQKFRYLISQSYKNLVSNWIQKGFTGFKALLS